MNIFILSGLAVPLYNLELMNIGAILLSDGFFNLRIILVLAWGFYASLSANVLLHIIITISANVQETLQEPIDFTIEEETSILEMDYDSSNYDSEIASRLDDSKSNMSSQKSKSTHSSDIQIHPGIPVDVDAYIEDKASTKQEDESTSFEKPAKIPPSPSMETETVSKSTKELLNHSTSENSREYGRVRSLCDYHFKSNFLI